MWYNYSGQVTRCVADAYRHSPRWQALMTRHRSPRMMKWLEFQGKLSAYRGFDRPARLCSFGEMAGIPICFTATASLRSAQFEIAIARSQWNNFLSMTIKSGPLTGLRSWTVVSSSRPPAARQCNFLKFKRKQVQVGAVSPKNENA